MIFTPNSEMVYLKHESYSNSNGNSRILFWNRTYLTQILLHLLKYKEELAFLFQIYIAVWLFLLQKPRFKSCHSIENCISEWKLWQLTLYFHYYSMDVNAISALSLIKTITAMISMKNSRRVNQFHMYSSHWNKF